jgi:hypothetical protein
MRVAGSQTAAFVVVWFLRNGLPMPIPRWILRLSLGVTVLAGCGGSPRYLLTADAHRQALQLPSSARTPLPAVAEDRAIPVHVERRKMRLEAAERVSDGEWRVRPRRPVGLLVTGSITLGIGAALMAAGLGGLFAPTPAGARNEGGIAYATELGLGAPHFLVGGILLLTGAARWSPEVR